jgi:hypothetical protein
MEIGNLRQAGLSPSIEADTLRSDTYNTMISNVALNDASFWTTQATENNEATRQVSEIRDAGNDIERVAVFDTLMSDKPRISPALVTAMRNRLISSINADRFFVGRPPLVAITPVN